jgi:hypothetical protein
VVVAIAVTAIATVATALLLLLLLTLSFVFYQSLSFPELLTEMPAVLERLDTLRLRGHASHIPLILIHDGGGTIFEYYMLGPLYRRTYGIPNPYFHDGGSPPAGGVPQLAKEYAEAIQATIRNGPILIGGTTAPAPAPLLVPLRRLDEGAQD